MRLEEVYIDSVGSYLPESFEARKAVEAGLYDEELRQATGFERACVASDLPALEMAVAAASVAIERASVERSSIDYFVHGGAYYQGPMGWASNGYLMRRLGLGEMPSLEVHQQCNGMMAALEAAIGHLTGAAGGTTALLTTASNYSTPLVNRWRDGGPQNVLSDGAAALLVTRRRGFAQLLSLNSATLPSAEGWQRGNESLLPPTDGSAWGMNLVERAMEYAATTGEVMQDWLDETVRQCREVSLRSLADAGLDLADVNKVISFHMARYALEETVLTPLGTEIKHSNWEIGRQLGHLGPGDHVVSLERMLQRGMLGTGDHALLVSWGAGWTTTAAVVRILRLPAWAERCG